jgi:hypothetical protein
MIESKKMARERMKDDSSYGSRRKESEGLINLAEELKDKCDSANRRIEFYRLMQICMIAFSLFFVVYNTTVVNFKEVSSFSRIFYLAFILLGFIYALAFELMIRRMKQRIIPDMAALSEVVQLLRETEVAIAEAENWSALDRAEFRIRLSRFGIGHKQYN